MPIVAITSIDKIPCLYHFTDRRNLDSIKAQGGLHPLAELEKKGVVIPAAGGNQWSRDADAFKGMGKYVHLCFCEEHPMEFRARQDGRITESIFLKIDPSVLKFEGVKFAPDVSNKAGVELLDLAEAEKVIDFEVLYTRTEWSNQLIKERRKKVKKYEVLVPSFIPLKLIRNI
ncbi:MAG: DUF4433 domain-containing protein [Rhodopseudomonas palustris]|uniref:DUF4433 domain-containing protein n=1 Tax=Rhodopseudomonas palustris TaxID=1076 RepID=A0A933W0P2_RHOPL|nr:DUF4433 domain-containing protein [Rhodopseudomonas palustris]